MALVLTRQKLPVLDLASYPGIPAGVPRGGYVLADAGDGTRPDIVLIATGSEVHLALNARDRLASEGVKARVVSLPCWSLFKAQPEPYRKEVLPEGVPLARHRGRRDTGLEFLPWSARWPSSAWIASAPRPRARS